MTEKAEPVAMIDEPKWWKMHRLVYGGGTISPCIFADQGAMDKGIKIMEDNLRIRKLTERECMRLMGYEDEEIDTLYGVDEKGRREFSKTAIYRFAGNSIVVDCLTEVFDAVLFPKNEEPKGLDRWLS